MRKIIHIDMDSFFAAVEVKHNSELLGKPIAVGGKAENRGVIATASYEARKYGVKSAMSTSKALRLCPKLVLVYPKFHLYKEESSKIFEIFRRYTKIVEPLSVDEAFLDVTQSTLFNGSATLIAKDIRKTILMETGLTASAGIANNKFLAKVCSDIKKPNGQFTVSPEKNFEFASQLPVRKIFGVGKVTAKKMKSMGVLLCSDLQKFSKFELQKKFGSFGESLYDLCRGTDNRSLKTSRFRKSFSVERTFSKDLTNLSEIQLKVEEVYTEFLRRFENSPADKNQIKTYFCKIKYHDFKSHTKETAHTKEVPSLKQALSITLELWSDRPQSVRLLGFGVKLSEASKETSQLEFNLI